MNNKYTKNLDAYKSKLSELERLKQDMISKIVNEIKTISVNPIHIGNNWFFYTIYEGKEVPAYCHANDYKEGCKFIPIYDEKESGEFGWTNFEECCRIFDMIEDRLLSNL